jgi:hypothetical protein
MSILNRIGMMALVFGLAACGSSPKPALYSFDEGVQPSTVAHRGVSLAVMSPAVPELYDRPQMVLRQSGNRIQVLDQQRWSEPLRQQIARVVASELGRRLESSSVIALPENVQALNPDYRLQMNVQRIDASLESGLGIDVAWRLAARDGTIQNGRSTHVTPLEKSGGDAYGALAEAYRRAFMRVAQDVAGNIAENRQTAGK